MSEVYIHAWSKMSEVADESVAIKNNFIDRSEFSCEIARGGGGSRFSKKFWNFQLRGVGQDFGNFQSKFFQLRGGWSKNEKKSGRRPENLVIF